MSSVKGRYLFIYGTVFAREQDGEVDWAMDWDSLSVNKGWNTVIKAAHDPENKEFTIEKGTVYHCGKLAKPALQAMIDAFNDTLREEGLL